MPDESYGRPRVLIGNLGPVARVGMRELVAEQGGAVIGEHGAADTIVREAARLQPDILVLALDAGPSRMLGARVRAAAPAAKLIFWAGAEDVVEVQAHGSRVRRRIAMAPADALGNELRGVPTTIH